MKHYLSIFTLFFILYCLFFIPPVILAQEASPTPTPATLAASANPIGDFINNLIAAIKGKKVDTTMQSINEAKLPSSARVIPVQQPKEEKNENGLEATFQSQDNAPNTDPIYNAAGQYAVASWMQTPNAQKEKRSTNLADFFADILGNIKGIAERGDKKALEVADSQLPGGVAKEVLSQMIGGGRQNLAQGEPVKEGSFANTIGSTQVLGLTTAAGNQSVMPAVLSLLQCANLPFTLNNQLCQNVAPTKIPGSDQTPSATPPPKVPASPVPSSPPVSTKCDLGKGLCDVDFLKPYFQKHSINDEKIWQEASIVCMKESGGSSTIINDRCLIRETFDYSIGLFQINLLAHCPEAFSYKNSETKECTIAPTNKLNECVGYYQDVNNNIEKAIQLYLASAKTEGCFDKEKGVQRRWSCAWGAALYCGII